MRQRGIVKMKSPPARDGLEPREDRTVYDGWAEISDELLGEDDEDLEELLGNLGRDRSTPESE